VWAAAPPQIRRGRRGPASFGGKPGVPQATGNPSAAVRKYAHDYLVGRDCEIAHEATDLLESFPP